MKKREKTLPVVLKRKFKREAMWGFSRSIARWKANELFFQEPSSLNETTSVLVSIFANFRARRPFFYPFFLLPYNTVNVTVQATTKFGGKAEGRRHASFGKLRKWSFTLSASPALDFIHYLF